MKTSFPSIEINKQLIPVHSFLQIRFKFRSQFKLLPQIRCLITLKIKSSVINIESNNSVKSLGYIKCCSLSSLRPVKTPSNSIRNNCQKICSWSTRPKIILEITRWSTILLFISFSKTFYKFISYSKTKFFKKNLFISFSIFFIYTHNQVQNF